MYTKINFAKDLKEKIDKEESLVEIGIWAHEIYMDYEDTKDAPFLNLLIALGTMELGEAFALSYEKLNEVADKLMHDEIVDLYR